jgi:Ca-activated chloride channel family protein
MIRKICFPLLFGLMLIFSLVGPVQADGMIIPTPCGINARCVPPLPNCDPGSCPRPMMQLAIRYHHVTVKIDNQVAVTHVDQMFYNPNEWPVEGVYIFPLPVDAAVSQFILWIDGEAVEGKVLDAQKARQVYEEIVRSSKDPALLEYIGRGAVQASVFPIPPHGERRIELEYTQVLTADHGLVKYVFPLNTEKFSVKPLENVSVKIQILDNSSIRAVYSPTHPTTIQQKDKNHVSVIYEANDITPDSDFGLYYSKGVEQAFHLLTYRDPYDPQEKDGFFLLMLAPSPEEAVKPISKDILLVLDHSGSMDGEKFSQVKSAVRFILQHLNPDDRFYLQAFNSQVQVFSDHLNPSNQSEQGNAWVDKLSAGGSTDINRALLEAAAVVDRERPTYLIFLTDGLPTEGVTESQEIIKNFDRAAPANLRMFPFGVGYDVDTILLDTISSSHHGLSTYVTPGDSLDESLSSFYARISTPVLTNLTLDFGSLVVNDLFPDPLPDLFSGSQVVVVGRYRAGKTTDVLLKGDVNGMTQTFRYPGQSFSNDSRSGDSTLAELPRLWATRKIGFLLNKIRLQGADQETIDQIVRLSIRYGVITPYTSYLVTESAPLGAQNQERVAQQALKDFNTMPTESSGQGAVQKAVGQGGMSRAEVAPGVPDSAGQSVKMIGSHTFVFINGVWTDTSFDPDKMKPAQVAFLSPDYFALGQSRPEIGSALALGTRVIVVVDGKAYEVVAENNAQGPLELPATLVPTLIKPIQVDTAMPSPRSGVIPDVQTETPVYVSSVGTQISSTPTPDHLNSNTTVPQQTAIPANSGNPGCFAALMPMAGVVAVWILKLRK